MNSPLGLSITIMSILSSALFIVTYYVFSLKKIQKKNHEYYLAFCIANMISATCYVFYTDFSFVVSKLIYVYLIANMVFLLSDKILKELIHKQDINNYILILTTFEYLASFSLLIASICIAIYFYSPFHLTLHKL